MYACAACCVVLMQFTAGARAHGRARNIQSTRTHAIGVFACSSSSVRATVRMCKAFLEQCCKRRLHTADVKMDIKVRIRFFFLCTEREDAGERGVNSSKTG